MSIGRKMSVLFILAIIGMNLYAQESGFTFKPYGGGGATATFDFHGGYVVGGLGEFAFLFYDKGLQISNHIVGRWDFMQTASENKYSSGSFSEKISLGGFFIKNIIRAYGFIEGGAGVGGAKSTGPLLKIVYGGGGGIDFLYNKYGSMFLEVGYLQNHLNNETVGGLTTAVGFRGEFKRIIKKE
jgi:hypothetical protein